MSEESSEPSVPDDEPGDEAAISTDRTSPVGKPVIRGDPSVTGRGAAEAVAFDPDDPEGLDRAAETVAAFASEPADDRDSLFILRGAAACAALVRGEGSYVAACERAGEGVSVSFVQKWARVHDLPRSVRRHVATRDLSPSAAKHIARLTGPARLHLAWAALDHGLTVREVRAVTSEVKDGAAIEDALAERGLTLGELTVTLPVTEYCKLRQESSLRGEAPGGLLGEVFADWLDRSDS